MKFKVCIPYFDETAWHEVESDDAEAAAESYVSELCSRDPECFSSFEGDGLVLLVRGIGSTTTPVMVTAEMEPSYTARRLP
jgi:hypothetical protein